MCFFMEEIVVLYTLLNSTAFLYKLYYINYWILLHADSVVFSHTEQAGGGWVFLDGLSHVVLYSLPDLPFKSRMQDVEGLQGMKHPIPLVLREDGVVCLVIPL